MTNSNLSVKIALTFIIQFSNFRIIQFINQKQHFGNYKFYKIKNRATFAIEIKGKN